MLLVEKGGIYIKTDTPLPLDSRIMLKMTLPGDPYPIEAEGTVVLSSPKTEKGYFSKGMGIKFEKISPEDHEKIMTAVENHKGTSQNLAIF